MFGLVVFIMVIIYFLFKLIMVVFFLLVVIVIVIGLVIGFDLEVCIVFDFLKGMMGNE